MVCIGMGEASEPISKNIYFLHHTKSVSTPSVIKLKNSGWVGREKEDAEDRQNKIIKLQ